MSQKIGRPEEREEDEEMDGQWGNQNTHNIYRLNSLSYMGAVCGAPKQLQHQRLPMTDHHNKYDNNGKV